MVSALKSRVNPTEHPPPASELYGKEHMLATQMMYEVSPCFKLASFMAANLAILEGAAEHEAHKIHVVDIDIGEGRQYMHFLQAFKLHKLQDESVTMENLRDEMLRLVKGLSPTVVTIVEQEMNDNTALLTVRVRAACEHYDTLFSSLEATVSRENSGRARVSMSGFQSVPMSQSVAESLRVKLNSGTCGNPGFTVKEQSGGICFGWMGIALTPSQ
ncbi:hypothetical protein ACS0TY_013265 [Phlomoides rotata]